MVDVVVLLMKMSVIIIEVSGVVVFFGVDKNTFGRDSCQILNHSLDDYSSC